MYVPHLLNRVELYETKGREYIAVGHKYNNSSASQN